MTHLRLPVDARAVDLFEHLNGRFFDFIHGLPAPLKELAKRKSTFLGSEDDEAFPGVQALNPVLAATPWMFWETFDDLEDEQFLDIAEAGTTFVLASILLDHLVDGQADSPEELALLQQAFYEHGVRLYRKALPASSHFWIHFERLADDHLVGLSKELETQEYPRQVALEELQIMAHGKVSPIVTTAAALAEATEQPQVLKPIEDSLKEIAVASQMLDDVGDWAHDVEVGHLTCYLSHLAPTEAWEATEWPSIEELQAKIDAEWVDIEHLRLVINWLDRSIDAVNGLDCPGWIEYVGGYRSLTDEHMTTAMARHLVRTLRPMVQPKGRS